MGSLHCCHFSCLAWGQIVKGQILKAIGIWIALGISWLLQFILTGFLLLPLIWIWQIYDAYND